MRKSLAATLMVALLSGCTEHKPEPVHDIIQVSIWKVSAKWIEDGNSPEPCYRFSLRKTEKIWDDKAKFYRYNVDADYKCVPIRAYYSLNPGDEYIEQQWWTQ